MKIKQQADTIVVIDGDYRARFVFRTHDAATEAAREMRKKAVTPAEVEGIAAIYGGEKYVPEKAYRRLIKAAEGFLQRKEPISTLRRAVRDIK